MKLIYAKMIDHSNNDKKKAEKVEEKLVVESNASGNKKMKSCSKNEIYSGGEYNCLVE